MKVTITEIDGVADGLRPLGLAAWGQMDGVSVAVLSGAAPVTHEPMATSAALAPVKHRQLAEPAAKRKYAARAPKPAKPAKVKKAKVAKAAEPTADESAPRLTIRARVIALLKERPMGSTEMAQALRDQGVAIDTGNASQQMYLLTRDGLAVRDPAIDKWRLTAA